MISHNLGIFQCYFIQVYVGHGYNEIKFLPLVCLILIHDVNFITTVDALFLLI